MILRDGSTCLATISQPRRPRCDTLETLEDRRLGGEIAVERRPPTGKSVSVSCSCRACVRAGGRGEAAREPPDCKPVVGTKVRAPARGGPWCPVFVPGCPGNVARGVPPVSREMWPAVSRRCPGDGLAWSGGAPRVVPWLSWLVSHC